MRVILCLILGIVLQQETFAKKSLAVTTNNSDAPASVKNTVDSLNDEANNIFLKSPDSARLMAEKALLISEKSKYKSGIGRSFLNIGMVYWSQSYYPIALFYLDKALMNLPKNEPLLISDCYSQIGRTHADLKNYPDAFKNLDKAARFAHGDINRLAEVFSERSYIYLRLQKYSEAIAQAKHSLALNTSVKAYGDIAILYGRLASIFTHKNEYATALLYLDTANALSLKTHNRRLRATVYINYASIYNQQRQFDKAIAYGKKSVALSDSIGVVDALSSAYRVLVSSYKQQNNLGQAMLWQQRYNDARDSLDVLNKVKSMQLIQNYSLLNKRLNDIDSIERYNQAIKARIHTKNTTIVTLALLLIFLLILLYITYNYYKQKEQLSSQLHEQHEELLIQKQLIEVQATNLQAISNVKDKLLAVIGHDLRTPFANLSNIIQMFEMGYLSAEEVQELMKSINSSVKGAELTLTNLVEWAGSEIRGRSVNTTEIDVFLIGAEMAQTFHNALQLKKIWFFNKIPPGRLVQADENHIKVVLRNLLSNAIKFTDTEGHITLSSKYEENHLAICVEDDGKGMTNIEMDKLFSLQTHFSKPGTMGEPGTGIGLLLCKELIELNGGRLWIESSPGKGSRFYFSLPLNAALANTPAGNPDQH